MATPLSIVSAHTPWTEHQAASAHAAAEREITARFRRLNVTFQSCTAIAAAFHGLSFLAGHDQLKVSPLVLLGCGVAFAIPAIKTATHPTAAKSNLRRWEIDAGYIPLTPRQLTLLNANTTGGTDDASRAAQAWLAMGLTLRQRDLVPLREARHLAGLPFPQWEIDEITYVVDGKPTFAEQPAC